MSPLAIVTCNECGTPVRLVDGVFRCPKCGAEMHLDEHGEEVWVSPAQLEEVAL